MRSELLPALEEVFRCHLRGLEELVEHHGEFDADVLKSAAVSAHTHTHTPRLVSARDDEAEAKGRKHNSGT